ncbi:MAG: cytochrome C biogenesis protein CycH [Flavobacteriia bacterium]|nr:cytochrome C biogenesis protein CycH [Flavobacteriia bacterium]OIP48637.1 MAG: cytochrome C biogenesis protein CycH [Flavobacteriaceae bacterium CG2_30_31_66]PIV95592.1 MAG: cytochrome C biogenesis protein CycH [Flavobacteriaceae bacterium CG17_big_fil_post_rev_8_21_14_2_50_31_13]PIX12378.1 MAG: cytochrome C biogenesis protein CycH [Flavobacteriaceae bacterium CG_4_8_14_3_um_filter_31_8]PIY15971.1 MAG: cytochrome C biogenesis protein CycH [Flavobacteriaceae bacterium CG_4_10_14_3_um_filter_3
MNKLISFKSAQEDNKFEVVLDEGKQTFWATEQQIASLFKRDRTVISKHLKNIFKEQELIQDSVCAKFAHTANDGKTYEVSHYNLDVIISVGYRVKSKIATEFRIWATNIIKEHLTKGYSINEKRLEQLQKTIQLIQRTSKLTENTEGLLDILADYSAALDILDKFDHQSLSKNNVNNLVSYKIEYEEAKSAIEKLKVKFGGSDLFGNEKDQSFKSSIATIDQTFDGKELYPSIEEKAANLLYFVVKNHSFSDGNKRIAAWLFVWYLDKNNYLYKKDQSKRIENNTLVALTLLIAESNPAEKEMMINVIINLIN